MKCEKFDNYPAYVAQMQINLVNIRKNTNQFGNIRCVQQ